MSPGYCRNKREKDQSKFKLRSGSPSKRARLKFSRSLAGHGSSARNQLISFAAMSYAISYLSSSCSFVKPNTKETRCIRFIANTWAFITLFSFHGLILLRSYNSKAFAGCLNGVWRRIRSLLFFASSSDPTSFLFCYRHRWHFNESVVV
jgi:hypothetical protein